MLFSIGLVKNALKIFL